MEFINPLATQYAETFTSPESNLLKEINDRTTKYHSRPDMLSGHVQGRTLSFLSTMAQPKYILEIGAFVGYSALCLAEGLRPDGELHTIELTEENAKISRENFALSNRNKQITLHVGNAVDIIPALNYKWDLVFIDADKMGYVTYYDLVINRLSENGIIITDNVLFHGEVLEKEIKGKFAKAIQDFNIHVANDSQTDNVLLTVRDGLMLIKKKK
ncbi:MAG: O-methyltransferase [Chitinophagaceae bacterium]|jgi:predicted O-methyltransferase YrrM|nr:O-methyltransferase [Chitinophagaceae bacterium]